MQPREITGTYADSSLSLRLGSVVQDILNKQPPDEQKEVVAALQRMLCNFCRASNKIAHLSPRNAIAFSEIATKAISEATLGLG